MQAKHRDWSRTLVWSVPAILVGLPLAMFVGGEHSPRPVQTRADYPQALSPGEPGEKQSGVTLWIDPTPALAQQLDEASDAGVGCWGW